MYLLPHVSVHMKHGSKEMGGTYFCKLSIEFVSNILSRKHKITHNWHFFLSHCLVMGESYGFVLGESFLDQNGLLGPCCVMICGINAAEM